MKKVLSLVLVIAMVLSCMSFAFATTFEDISVDNEKLAEVASLLNGLGIITGYELEDGTFEYRPEGIVTRAEMAAMLIRAKGYESIANDTPAFTDSQNHWAKGYIALASDLGVINGRGNGIFDPDATVTYQEAAVMMLRALGYTDESINGGKSVAYNAANYRTKALSLNLFKDFNLTAMNDGATRGNIALMLNKNLSNSIVFTNEDGRAVVEKDENNNAVKLLNSVAKKQTVTVDKKLAAKENLVDMTQYLYQEVEAYFKDEVVVFVDKVNSTVKTGEISAVKGTVITLGKDSDASNYTVKSSNESVFYNNDEVLYSAAQSVLDGSKATLVLDKDSNVIGIIANEETNAKLIKNTYKENSTVINSIALPTNSKTGKVDLSKVVVTGDVNAIGDIAVNDVVKAYASIGNTTVKLLVVRDSVEGKVVKTNNNGSKVFVDTIDDYRDVVNGTLSLNDAGTFYLDENGNIFGFVKTSSESVSDYSVVVEANNGVVLGSTIITNPTIKVMNAKGEKVTLTIAKDAKYDIVAANGKEGLKDQPAYTKDEAKNELTLADVLKAGSVIKSVVVKDEEVTKLVAQTVAKETKAVNVESKTFDTASNVVVFNEYKNDEKTEYTVNTLEELVALKTVKAGEFNHVTNANGEYSVIFVKGSAVVAPESLNGVIAEQQKVVNADGKIVHQFVTYINGEKVTYLSNEELGKNNVVAGSTLVKFSVSNGVVSGVSTVATSSAINVGTEESPIKNVTENTFMNDTAKYFMNDGAAIYVFDKEGNFVRVGAMSDLEGLNVTINLYVNVENNRLVENIVVIAK